MVLSVPGAVEGTAGETDLGTGVKRCCKKFPELEELGKLTLWSSPFPLQAEKLRHGKGGEGLAKVTPPVSGLARKEAPCPGLLPRLHLA